MYKAAFGPLFYYAKKGGLTTSDKLNSITALADDALRRAVDSHTEWASLLGTISRLYKYPFHDQLMIHAQRPEATACASYEVWNDTMRRYVRRGSKGIALVDNSGDAPRLRYVFDIADTGTRRSSRPFSPWEINDGNLAEVQLGLRQAFNSEGEWLSSQLQDVARDIAEMYFDAHRHDIAGIVDGSLMAGYDEGELRDSFIKAAYASTAYAMLSRCGYDPAAYFDEADFAFLSELDTPEAVTALGTAVSENTQIVLRQIERTIRSYERSQSHDRDNLHDRERRPTAEPEPAGDGANRPLRAHEAALPQGAPAYTVEPDGFERNTVAAPARDGESSAEPHRPDAAKAGGGSGRNGGTEGRRPDEVDRAYEQLQGPGRRSSSERIDLQLNLFDEAEDAQAPSAFSFPQEDADHTISDAEREQYEMQLVEALVNDSAYINAVRNSDRQNALAEGFAAIRRIAAASTDIRFQKLYHDNAEFRNGLRNDVLAAAYKEVSVRGNVAVEQIKPSHEPTPAVYIPVDGEWQGFPSVEAAQKAALEEFQKETRRRARNFRIADEHLGEGGAKAKCRANIEAIRLLKYLEENDFQASSEQQEVLSRYVGWGGIPEVFDENKPDWSKEYAELKSLLTPEEYEAARGSTLNAHYTSPAVIKAIYEAVGSMGFEGGRILEPSMGVGNFFGLLPESMQGSQLYGVELDSITGRIAKQLYPEANITVAGFETTNRPGFFDLAVGNVPFGQYQVHDPEYDRLGFSIHNYFAAKMLDQVRPGGIVAFVTSRYTLDAKDESVRRFLAERGELLGAIKLPNNAFRANAGTDVVSDIIFLQRREQPLTELPDWVHVGTTPEGFTVNRYFIDHPDMVLGTPSAESTQYGRQDYTVAPIEGADLSELLHLAVQNIHGEYTEREMEEAERSDILPADPDVRNYSFTLVDGEVYYREGGIMVRQDVSAAMTERIKGLMELRDCTRRLIQLQTEDASDAEIAAEQRRLNTLYDAYTAKHGLISSRENKRAFSDDSSYYLLCSLEILNEDGKLERKADMFTRRTIQPHRPVEHTETAAEALAVSLNELGRVDMEYMSRLCGKSETEIAAELSGVIFRVPGEERYATADEYLSGNVREKLREAEAAAKSEPSFNVNVEALRAARPRELTASEIDVRLGATWIEPRYIEQFMVETFQPTYWASRSMSVNYSPYTSEWRIEGKSAVSATDVNAFSTYGTSRISAYKILENTLNLRDVRIYDKVEEADGTERRVLNVKETTLAQQKQQVIKDAFRDWLWKDPKRRETLVAKYNELFNSTRPREYDGSHLTFPGMNPEIELREHQRNAIARILYGGNTLLAHEVGAGKTFTMAAAAMEAKRLGLCRKPMFAVPNHLTEQWASEFLRLYPSANILVATKKDFEPANRKKFCARIATGDYDAVIIGHSQFERIPVSQERQERLLRSEIEDITEGINQLKRSSGERFSIKAMEKTKKSLEAKLKKLLDSPKDDVVTFEELGVDRLFVDEAHSHKNLYYHTKMQNVAGLSSAEAQKSTDMYMKCRYMDELTGSRGIVFATGTPVSNSMTELYTMQRYLQHDTLERLGLGHFDSWAANFGETVTALELAPEGTGYRARTRFSKFFNLPELMNLFREAADIKTADQLNLPKPEVVYHNEVSQPTEIQKKLVQELSERATKVHARMVDPSEDNMLAITNDGRKLGLDQRVVNPLLPDADGTKVNRCVDNVFRIWQDGAGEKLTQLIFCDLSTPGKGFNIYDDIKTKLISRGVPESEIAFIHDANTEEKKKALFSRVRSGNVRVLLGSTGKMGAGTNVQDRLVALHDLDAPWRPGDLEQRKGRIARQGNMNETVHVYRYVTEQTFDSYIWQTLENKQRFISQIMTSKSPVRSCEDADETTLSYAEVKALCAGDPRIREKMDLDVQVAKLRLLKSSHQSQKYQLEDRLLQYYPREIAATKAAIMGCEADIKTRDAHPAPADGLAGIELQGQHYDERVAAGEALLNILPTVQDTQPVHVGSFRGFDVEVSLEAFGKHVLTLKGALEHHVELGADARGNISRIENTLTALDKKLGALNTRLSDLERQVENAREELGKPFPQEDELREKSARLVELNAELDMENNSEPPEAEKPSVLAKLKEPIPLYEPKNAPSKEACR